MLKYQQLMKHEKYWLCFYQDEYIAQVAFPPAMPTVDFFCLMAYVIWVGLVSGLEIIFSRYCTYLVPNTLLIYYAVGNWVQS